MLSSSRSFSAFFTLALPLAFTACGDGDDPSGAGGSGGDGGAGDSGAATIATVGATPVAAATTLSSVSTTYPTTTGDGGGGGTGGDGGTGGEAGLACTDAPLPGAGGCDAGDPRAVPDDCATVENEGCTARALCGSGAPPFPRPAGPGVAYAERDGGVGTVDGDLRYTELLGAGRIIGTSRDGRALVEDFAASSVSVLDADGNAGPSWVAGGFDRGAFITQGRIVVGSSISNFASIDGVVPEGEGELALAALKDDGAVSWARKLGTSDDPGAFFELRGIAALGGDVVVVGVYEREIDLGGVALPAAFGGLGFVARVDGETGDVLWAEPIGDPLGGTANTVAVIDDEDILVGGSVVRDDELGHVATLVRLSSDGDVVWESRTESNEVPSDHVIKDIAVSAGGQVVAVGFFDLVLRAGGVEIIDPSFARDAMILSFDAADGAITSVRTWGSEDPDDPLLGDKDDRASRVSAFCEHVVVEGEIGGDSRAVLGGHTVENHADLPTVVVLELPAEGTWPTEGDEGDVCAEPDAYCEARVERSLSCGTLDDAYGCIEDEPCLGSFLRDDVACASRTCEAEAACDVDCEETGLDTELSETGAAFETACEAAIGGGCDDYLPVGTCARMAHRDADPFLEAMLPCVTPARSCVSTWVCLEEVRGEWEQNLAGCGAEPALDPSICEDDATLCDAIVQRNEDCGTFGSSTPSACLANRAGFQATYRDEVECLLESCFAEAACNVDCRGRAVLVPPSALGEELIEGCLLVGNCADLFTGECVAIAHAWPDDRIAQVLPCFDGSLSCDDAADCLGDAGSNTWYP